MEHRQLDYIKAFNPKNVPVHKMANFCTHWSIEAPQMVTFDTPKSPYDIGSGYPKMHSLVKSLSF